jgi:hypothetical protein
VKKDAPAIHCMEYIHGIFVDDVVQNFKQIAVAVEA